MDLCTLEKVKFELMHFSKSIVPVFIVFLFAMQNVKKKMYGCTEAFLADAKWILHNCIIYNGGMVHLSEVGNRLNIPPSVSDQMFHYIKKIKRVAE